MTDAAHAERRDLRIGGLGRLFYGLGLAVLLGLIIYVGRAALIPLVVAAFLSFLIVSLKTTIQATPRVGRRIPDTIAFLVGFFVIGGGFVLFVEIVRSNVETLVEAAPAYQERLRAITGDVLDRARASGLIPADFVLGVDQVRREGLRIITPILSDVASGARALAGNLVTIFLYTAFMLVERRALIVKIGLMAQDHGDRAAINEILGDIGDLVRRYISIKTLTGLIVAGLSYVVLLVLGVDFAGFWALLILILNFIPIIGAITAITLPVLLALVQPEGGGIGLAALTLALLTACEQFTSSAVEPRLMGRSLNLSPLVILLSLSVWGAAWGIAGMLLCVPIMVALMLCLSQFHTTRPIAILMSQNGKISPIKRDARRLNPEAPGAPPG